MFHRPKPKKFEYVPRFYDPKKEELEEKLKAFKDKEQGIVDAEAVKHRLSKGFARNKSRPMNYSRRRSSSNRLLLLIIVVLCIIFYVFLGPRIQRIIDAWSAF